MTESVKLLIYCEQKAIEIILDNRVIIDLIVERLLEVETIDGEEFRRLLSTYTIYLKKMLRMFQNLIN